MQKSLSLLSALPCWFKPAVTNGPAKMLLTQIGANKSRGKDAGRCKLRRRKFEPV